MTATSSAVDSQSNGPFKNLTTTNIPDRHEERVPWTWFGKLVNKVDNFKLRNDPDKAKIVDKQLAKISLQSRPVNVFWSRKFMRAVDKILIAHSGDLKLAQEATFIGLERATRAEDRADMLFELGRTIGWCKNMGVEERPKVTTSKSAVRDVEAENVRARFVLGLEPHLLNFWAKSEDSPETVRKGLKNSRIQVSVCTSTMLLILNPTN